MSEHSSGVRTPPWVMLLATIGFIFIVGSSLLIYGGFWAFKSIGASLSNVNGHVYTHKISHGPTAAIIILDGQITAELADKILEKLVTAETEKKYVGVMLEVNSPGGSVVASQEIYDMVEALKATKPVVVYMREVAASGAYYASAPASKIVANRGTMVGSIGVILQSFETSQLITWLKLKPMTLKTGSLKDAGSPLREWTPHDKDYLQRLINTTRDQFVQDVAKARSLPQTTIDAMSDGRVVLGAEALDLKLVDALGSKQTAKKILEELAGVSDLSFEVIPDKVEIQDVLGKMFRIGAQQFSQTLTLDQNLRALPAIEAR